MPPTSRAPTFILLTLLAFLLVPAPSGGATLVIERRAAVRPGSREALAQKSLLESAGTTGERPFFAGHTGHEDPLARFVEVDLPAGSDQSVVIGMLLRSPEIRSITADVVMPLLEAPDDPYFAHSDPDSAQWPLDGNPSGPDLDALAAWNVTAGDDVIVAVLDSGVDWRHPDLAAGSGSPGAIWSNQAEAEGIAGHDDDGNGFIDDLRGWDFVSVDSIAYDPARLSPGEDGYLPDNDPDDVFGHGTFVAGLLGARSGNGIGMAGAAPECRVMPVRVGWKELPNSGVVSMNFCAKAIVYAADNGARVLNCSWLSDATPALTAALDYAIGERGVVVVDAAGNGGLSTTQSRNYLSRRGDCIEVAALSRDGVVAAQSSIGTWVDLAAPGAGLLSLAPSGGAGLYRIEPSGATSFAAPFVAAAAALLLSGDPDLDPPTVRERLMAAASPIDSIGANWFYAGKLGAGLVNLARTVKGYDPPPPAPIAGVLVSPNPSRALVTFAWEGEGEGTNRLAIYDLMGRLVGRVEGPSGSGDGELTWDGRNLSGRPVAGGVYHFVLETPLNRRTGRLVRLP